MKSGFVLLKLSRRSSYFLRNQSLILKYSKTNIAKLMLLATIGWPRIDFHKILYFFGKVDIWPFVIKELEQLSNKNHPKGNLRKKPLEIPKTVYKKMLINNLLPSIKEK